MTVATTISKSGPYAGAGSPGPFTVGFRFLENDHLRVTRTSATGVDVTLVLGSDYSVSGAGLSTGSVTLVTALLIGERLTITRNVPATQEADYVANDAFPAESHEEALDKLTMLVQQAAEVQSRSIVLPVSALGVSPELPQPKPNQVLSWDEEGKKLTNIDQQQLVSVVAFGTAVGDLFSGNGSSIEFTLSSSPGTINNLDVAIEGVTQRPGIDYLWASGTSLIFTSPPPAPSTPGDKNILVRYMRGLPTQDSTLRADLAGTGGANLVRFDPSAIYQGGTVAAALMEQVSVDMLGAKGDGITNDSAVFQAALSAGRELHLTRGKAYRIATPLAHTGAVRIIGNGAIILADGKWLTVTDGSDSYVTDFTMNNVQVPFTIQRNFSTWENQTAADVTQKNNGYMPTGNDTDIWPDLPDEKRYQNIGPHLIFRSSSSAPNARVMISKIKGNFALIELQGYQYSTVKDCKFKAGWGDGILFWNGVSFTFPYKTPLGYQLARGIGNSQINNVVLDASFNCIATCGNDYPLIVGNHAQGAGESLYKTYQKENPGFTDPAPVGAVSYHYKICDNTGCNARYDGIDANSVYDDNTPVKEPTFGLVDGNVLVNCRSTGIVSNAPLVTVSNNHIMECGVFGLRVLASNVKVSGNHVVNNVRLPGILGPFNSYDIYVNGNDIKVSDNLVFRGNEPAYSHAIYVDGTGQYESNTSNKQVYVGPGIKSAYMTRYGALMIGNFSSEYPWSGLSAIDAELSGAFGGRQGTFICKNSYYDGSTWRRKNNNGEASLLYEQSFLGNHVWSFASNGVTGDPITFIPRLTLNTAGQLYPGGDNSTSLGIASNRWSVVYAGTSTINTSDENAKDDIEFLNDAEMRVARSLKSLVKKYRFRDAKAEKGDQARIHVGVIAQDVKLAFESCNLDPFRYGVLCFDEWESLNETKGDDGIIRQHAQKAGSRYGVRYDELFAFIIAAL